VDPVSDPPLLRETTEAVKKECTEYSITRIKDVTKHHLNIRQIQSYVNLFLSENV
jgi:hypothetical protein